MTKKNKIVLVGPSGSGKTTITNVFFKKANPLRLLNKPLEPTRGINSNLFSLFNSQLGIFDLAGQENENWFNDRKEVFEYADIIICVFDITSPLESMVSFLVKVLRTKKHLNSLSDCKIFVLLHKIDLINLNYFSQKVKLLERFKKQFPPGKKLDIYGTSIINEYFYDTYQMILEILKNGLKMNIIQISDSEFENLKAELEILLYFEISEEKNNDILASKLELSIKDLLFHLKRLKKLGFIIIDLDRNSSQLTQRGKFFREKLKIESPEEGLTKKNKGIELFYTFLELNIIPA